MAVRTERDVMLGTTGNKSLRGGPRPREGSPDVQREGGGAGGGRVHLPIDLSFRAYSVTRVWDTPIWGARRRGTENDVK